MCDTGSRKLFGRKVIYTEVPEINEGNIVDVLRQALNVHLANQADIDYLYRYYRGSAYPIPGKGRSAGNQ